MKQFFTIAAFIAAFWISNSEVKAQTPLLLDYDGMESGYYTASTDTSWRYTAYLWDVNRNFPNDSAFSLRFGSVFYDTLINYNYNTNSVVTSYPLSTSTVRLDSFQLFYNHIRLNTASTDTLYMYVFNISQATITGTGANAVFSAPWIWRDSLKLTGTQNANTSGVQINANPPIYMLTRRPNLTLPAGQSFGIYIEFRGHRSNRLQMIASYRNECSDVCVAEPAFAPDNSLYYLNFTQQLTNFSGINPITYDCDGSNNYTVGGCENFYIQNFWLPAYVTRTGAATSPTVVTNAATNVAQTTATLNGSVNANGNIASVVFDWGLTTSYGNTATATPANVSGSSATGVSANLTGLAPGTTYNFRVRATNSGGTTNGGNLTFTTLSGGGACTPNPAVTSGMSPTSSNVPCITQGQSFSQTFTFVIPNQVIYQGFPFPITNVTFDSIGNLPSGLTYSFNQNPAVYAGGASGCFLVTGTTNSLCGQYTMPIYVTVNASGQSFSGELSALASQFGLTGYEMRFLRVIAAGDQCPAVNQSQTVAFSAYPNCGTSGLSVTITKTDVNCFGQSTGTATAVATGGTTYTYTWSNGGNTATISNLAAGAYSVTVSSNGQTATASVSIAQPASVLSASATSTQAACGQTNGTATVSASGGTAPYTYSWSNGGSTASISALAAGSYTVTVIDSKSCTTTATTSVTTPSNFTLSVTTVAAQCYGGNTGSATVTVTGGTGPFNYQWSNGGTTSTISSLTAGSYSVTVSDGSGCTNSASGSVSQPANPLTVTATSTQSSCGAATGTATAIVTNNVGSPSYLWSNGGTTSTISNLSVGIYTVTATAGNCTATASVAVNNSNGPAVNLLKTDPTCFGSTNGSATAVASGGTQPYTYTWSTGATGSVLSGIGAGTYTVIVADQTGCQATNSVTLVQPNVLSTNGSVVNVNCNGGQTGAVNLAVSGGTGPYSYLWSNGGTSSSLANLGAGNYTVTLTDSKSCTAVSTYNVTQPSALTITTSSTGSTGNDGTATATVSGGTSPYNYNWSTTPSQNSSVASALAAGSYSVTITDSKGCSAVASVSVANLVGIEDAEDVIKYFSLFPNPANDLINVVVEFGNLHTVEFQITDMTGKVVYTAKETTSGRLVHEVKLSEFTSGVYIIEAMADKQTIRKRFMIVR